MSFLSRVEQVAMWRNHGSTHRLWSGDRLERLQQRVPDVSVSELRGRALYVGVRSRPADGSEECKAVGWCLSSIEQWKTGKKSLKNPHSMERQKLVVNRQAACKCVRLAICCYSNVILRNMSGTILETPMKVVRSD